ncbi:hypothetical protein DQ239_08520 [Blastococcus sp. TF02-09]|uniref:hypothetical protein n=1 Tax=Blastococcus sp. TF02-09 TaxID=2250576 RepID=UPI000DE85ED9|nr:hypothetical protein [Blastococcus sp. TF02-9]RBY78580.1 hypothetical protein DQ239_08520 [Blastococcus sp. TF02-9]
MLELGSTRLLGSGSGGRPVLADGAVVATLQASGWKEQARVVIGGHEWLFGKRRGELRGRWAVDPEESARLRARQVSSWKGTWVADLEGTRVDVEKLSFWTAAHRFVSGGRQVAHGGSTGGWSPRPTLTAVPGMPLHHQVFLLWLEMVVRGRSADGSAAAFGDGGGGGGD